MKIVELLNSIRLPITNEEAEILSLFDDKEVVMKEDLSPREDLLATNLVKKDVLKRRRAEDGKLVYLKKIR